MRLEKGVGKDIDWQAPSSMIFSLSSTSMTRTEESRGLAFIRCKYVDEAQKVEGWQEVKFVMDKDTEISMSRGDVEAAMAMRENGER